VRPESITVERAPGGAGSLAGRITKATYVGTQMEYTIETAVGALFATCPRVDRPLAAGDDVALTLAPRGLLVVDR
ncbi:MAG: TOBE domain-containing protein, partial [Reyranellaceae bacterium]